MLWLSCTIKLVIGQLSQEQCNFTPLIFGVKNIELCQKRTIQVMWSFRRLSVIKWEGHLTKQADQAEVDFGNDFISGFSQKPRSWIVQVSVKFVIINMPDWPALLNSLLLLLTSSQCRTVWLLPTTCSSSLHWIMDTATVSSVETPALASFQKISHHYISRMRSTESK